MNSEPPGAMSPGWAQLLAAGLGVAFIFGGWLIALSVDEVQLDVDHDSYQQRKGIWPWVRIRTGKLSELSHILLEPEIRTVQDKEIWVWCALLVWRDPGMKRTILFESATPDLDDPSARDKIHAQASSIAQRLGLEIQCTERSGDTAHATRILDRIRQRLYGTAEFRSRVRTQAAVSLGLMTIGSPFVRLTSDWQIADIIRIDGRWCWIPLVCYVAIAVVWEMIQPSVAGANSKRPGRPIYISLALVAASICLLAPFI